MTCQSWYTKVSLSLVLCYTMSMQDRMNDGNQLKTIRIMLADDHPLFRQALRSALQKHLDFEIVAESGDGQEAVRIANELKPDVVIMDVSLPTLDGIEATRQIKASTPSVAILALTVHDDSEHALGMLEAGAAGYLTKEVFEREVVQSIHSVIAGETVLSRKISELFIKHASRYRSKPLPLDLGEKLTVRELEILKLAAQGRSNRDIALELGLGLSTIKGYLVNVFAKLRVGSRTEAVITGLRAGFLTVDDIK